MTRFSLALIVLLCVSAVFAASQPKQLVPRSSQPQPANTNVAPLVSVTSVINKQVGETFTLAGTVQDTNGDEVKVTWIFLQDFSTVASTTIRPTSPQTVSATISGGKPAGTYRYKLRAAETSTVEKYVTEKELTVNVSTGSNPGTGTAVYEETNQAGCVVGNDLPTRVFSPDVKTGKPIYRGGDMVAITMTASDPSTTTTAYGVAGPGAHFIWDFSELNVSGVAPPVPSTVGSQTTATLTFTAPNQTRDAFIKVRVEDILGCGVTIRFAIRFEASVVNSAPSAVIKYKVGNGSLQSSTGSVTHSSQSTQTVTLDASSSTDPDGNYLSYGWSVIQAGAGVTTVSPSTGATTSFSIAGGATGTLKVRLTVTDTGNLSSTSDITFNVTAPTNLPPTAVLKYKVDSGTLQVAPATVSLSSGAQQKVITLDGSSSSDPENGALTYQWSRSEALTAGGVTFAPSGATASLVVNKGTAGTVTVNLLVKDPQNLASSPALVSFTITIPPPSASISIKLGDTVLSSGSRIQEGETLILDASESICGDGSKNHLTYEWRQVSGPPAGLVPHVGESYGNNTPIARFLVPDVTADGTEVKFELTVTDTRNAVLTHKTQAAVLVDVARLYFPQVGVGPLGEDDFRTVLLLINDTESPASGVSLEFFNSAGTAFQPIINGQPWTGQQFEIRPQSTSRLVFSGDQLQVGWARVRSNTKLAGLVLFQVVRRASGKILREVGLVSSPQSRRFVTFYDKDEETAVAVANPGDRPARVTVKVVDYDSSGQQRVVAQKILFVTKPTGWLDPGEHGAAFIDEGLLGTFPPSFKQGNLVLESDSDVVVTILKTQEGIIHSIVPVATRR